MGCTFGCGRVTGPVYTRDQCRGCWLAVYQPGNAPGGPSGPCGYEGPVSQPCLTCTGEKAEFRHVRLCLHPAPSVEVEFCTRGPTADPAKVRSCAGCPDRVAGG